MAAGGYLSLRDFDGEISTTSFNTGAITAISLPGLLGQWDDLRIATEAITSGLVAEEGLYVFRTRLTNVNPTSQLAQREQKWLVTYEDTTEFFDAPVNAIPNAGYRKIFNLEIGTADLSAVTLLNDTDIVDLATAPVPAWVSAFEAIARSPYGGAVNVVRINHVGRNS